MRKMFIFVAMVSILLPVGSADGSYNFYSKVFTLLHYTPPYLLFEVYQGGVFFLLYEEA